MNPDALCEPYETPGIYLFGLPMSQTFADLLLWERILNAHPVRSVVEIGTGEGGFSRYLAVQSSFRGFAFQTFDIVEPEAAVPGFTRADVFEQPELVLAALERPAVLFCDGGDKPREIATFAPHLELGDLLVAHDWGTEVKPADVPPTLQKIHADWTFELRSLSRVFERVWTAPTAEEEVPA